MTLQKEQSKGRKKHYNITCYSALYLLNIFNKEIALYYSSKFSESDESGEGGGVGLYPEFSL